jgi:hypothetical protein
MCDPEQGLALRIYSIQVNGLKPEVQIREQAKQHHRMTTPATGMLIATI